MSWANHPHVDDTRTRAERFVDWMGTGRFLLIQSAIVTAWVVVNLVAYQLSWDPYPFILLNLAFSTQAAYATPLLLMAGKSAERRNAQQAIAAHESLVRLSHHNASHVECDCE